MNEANRFFLKAIGIFFLLIASAMTMTGYWPSLQGFGVSVRFFNFLISLASGFGICALMVGIFSPQQKK